MFCSMCGSKNDDQASFCIHCGKALRGMPMSQNGYAIPSGSPSAYGTAYAGFWLRVAAALIDGLIMILPSFVIDFVIGLVLYPKTHMGYESMQIVLFIINSLISWLYYAITESSSKQGTFGKQIVGIKVTDLYGQRISMARATGRYFGMIISGLILGIGYLMVAFTEKKQALHDMMASCLVIKR